MTEFILVLIICGIISAAIGSQKGENTIICFIFGALLGIVGIIVVALIAGKKCPYCKSRIHTKAIKCPKCGKDIADKNAYIKDELLLK